MATLRLRPSTLLRTSSGQARQPLSRPFGFPKPEGSCEVHPNGRFPLSQPWERGPGGEGEAKSHRRNAIPSVASGLSAAVLSCVDGLGLGYVGKPGSVGATIAHGRKLLTCSPKQPCRNSHPRVSGKVISVTISLDSIPKTKTFSPSCPTK
jgi:hypothetical protein